MTEESKPVEVALEEQPNHDYGTGKGKEVRTERESDEVDVEAPEDAGGLPTTQATLTPAKKKKKTKKQKPKGSLANGQPSTQNDQESKMHKAIEGLSADQIAQLLEHNPALANEVQATTNESGKVADLTEAMKRMKFLDIMTGLASSGKNAKDMGAYKFWSTQPVVKFGDNAGTPLLDEGPIKIQAVEDVPKEPSPLVDGFEWCTVDLEREEELDEVCDLLRYHFVEDDDAMFRFNYSKSLLKWAMMPPGWKRDWHVGVRATQSKKLVAFISAVPYELRVRDKVLHSSEVNFLVVHKKLRSKRLAPVLIKEITRRCNLQGVFQAIYTGGTVLPTPVSTCRYYHRAINWQKLFDVGFVHCPARSQPKFEVRKYKVADRTQTKGLREMQDKDIDQIHGLLTRYLKRYDLAAEFQKADIKHWFLHDKKDGRLEDQVVWSMVVEDDRQQITDFFSFYGLDSSVLQGNAKHQNLHAAYLFYYASESGLAEPFDRLAHRSRLNALMSDAMVVANKKKFDVFNALSLMDNALFLDELKFRAGDGQLHYYLFNYRANAIAGGVDEKNDLDKDNLSGIGFVML